MINVVSKSGNLAHLLKVTTQAGANATVPIITAVPVKKDGQEFLRPQYTNSFTLNRTLLNGKDKVQMGPTSEYLPATGTGCQDKGKQTCLVYFAANFGVRCAHTDLKIPDFSYYRHSRNSDPNKKSTDGVETYKTFTYVVLGGTLALAAIPAKSIVRGFISSMSASKDVLAVATIEINLSEIPEGKNVTFKWRGKPLFVRHRYVFPI